MIWILIAVLLATLNIFLFRKLLQLQKINKLKIEENLELRRRGSDFVANVSHELKTPLTSIKGYTETLKGMVNGDPEKVREFLTKIEENSERLSSLITDILDLSKIESENVHLELERFQIAPLLDEIKEQFTHKLSQREQKLLMRSDVAELYADRKLFEQALVNLIENAHRYCPDGALIEVAGESVFESGTPLAKFEVIDNGPGISENDLPRIFERFYRADKSRNRLSGGTGLGLAIVKHIMVSHGGSIRVTSARGQGSRFTLLFPK
jgi:signal transduction histidine kinase